MIAAIGAFDGFHLGHQTLLARAAQRAVTAHDEWGIVTFSRHSGAFPGFKNAKSLFSSREQVLLERFFKIPLVHRIDFTPQLAEMQPQTFLDHIAAAYGVRGIVVGEDFRFGKDRLGTPSLLREECQKRGWSLDVVPIQKTAAGIPICSTTIRAAIEKGDAHYCRELLGYPFFCSSRVVHGNARGRKLGYPTANLEIAPEKAEIGAGVYATLALLGDEWHAGAANIGCNPTFTDVKQRRFEVNLLDYRGDLYECDLTVLLLARVRNEIRFPDAQALRRQIESDVEAVRGEAQVFQAKHPDLLSRIASSAVRQS